MKAIVLTYDNRHPIAELIMTQYDKIWPQNDFTYYVPYNHIEPTFKSNHNIVLIKTDKSIKITMGTLLKNIPDDEFVFWCFDDIYPIKMSKICLKSICQSICCGKNNSVDSVRLYCGRKNKIKNLTQDMLQIGPYIFHRTTVNNCGFWFPQFVKAKILRKVFINNGLDDHYRIRHIRPKMIPEHMAHESSNFLGNFAETTRFDGVTKNAYDLMIAYGINPPNLHILHNVNILDNIILSGKEQLTEYRERYLKERKKNENLLFGKKC